MNAPADTRQVLRANVEALMREEFGRINLLQLTKRCGIGMGTAQRIMDAETSVGVDILERIGKAFSFSPWQLLLPGFDPLRTTPHPYGLSPRALELARELDAIPDPGAHNLAFTQALQLVSTAREHAVARARASSLPPLDRPPPAAEAAPLNETTAPAPVGADADAGPRPAE